MPVEAGQSKTVKLKVRPPSTIGAGTLSGHGARRPPRTPPPTPRSRSRSPASRGSRSPAATAWCRAAPKPARKPRSRSLITNTGTAPADEVELTSTAPSGWKIEFEPKTIDRIPPGQNKEVQALVTPPEKAMAGDYAPTFNVASRGETASQQFRVAVVDLDHVGHRRRRHHRHRAADHGRGGGEVRPAMSDTVIEASGPDQALRRGHGGRRCLVHDQAWRDLRPARSERGRQDHDHPDDARPDRSDRTARFA